MNLLVFNLATDPTDPILGFATTWIRALAERTDRIDVVTMIAGPVDLPPNVRVRSVGKELGYSDPRRTLEFYRALAAFTGDTRYDACLAHMMPLFVVMGAPVLKLRRIPINLWYAHRATPLLMRVAVRLSDRVFTSAQGAFRVRSDKVRVVGQGVDTGKFVPPDPDGRPRKGFVLLAVGRVAPVKRLELCVETLAVLRADGAGPTELRLVGPTYGSDRAYEASLRDLIARRRLDRSVTFVGALDQDRLAAEYRAADVVLNTSPSGALDKVVLEGMASGALPVVTNDSFARVLPNELVVSSESPVDLASAIERLRRLSDGERSDFVARLRATVESDHSLGRLADRLVTEMAVRGARRA